MIIRQANAADSSFIQRLLIQLGYSSLQEKQVVDKIKCYQTDPYCLLVSEIDQAIVGFISLHWFDIFHSAGKIGRITAFCIDEKYRAQGIGTQLLEQSEKFFLSKGCTKFEVSSNARRTLTHQFYLKHGYVEDSKRFVKYI